MLNINNNIMKKFLIISLLALLPLMSQAQITEEVSHIEVRVSADREVTPDEIYLSVIIKEEDYKKKSLADLEYTLFKTIKNIDGNLVDELKVSDLSSNFKDYIILKSKAKLQKHFILMVSDAQTAGQVIADLQEAGISEVNLYKTDISNKEEIMDELRVEAMKKAKARASMMAKAIDQKIMRAYRVSESSYYPQRFNSERVFYKASSADAAEAMPELEFEKSKLEVTVNVRFELF